MTKLKAFVQYLKDKGVVSWQHYCTCGGYASSMSGRDPEHPHMSWCPQAREWEREWTLFETEGLR